MLRDIIEPNSKGIVVKERSIILSDEKMKSILRQVYEEAESISTRFRIYKFYDVLFSISGTLMVAKITSSFNSFGSIDASCIADIVNKVILYGFILGVIFLGYDLKKSMKNNIKMRDETINKIFQKNVTGEE